MRYLTKNKKKNLLKNFYFFILGGDQQAKSTPTVVELNEGRRACDMSLGSKHTAIASFNSEVLLIDRKGSFFLPSAVYLIAGGPLTILSSTKWQLEVALQPLAIEQVYLFTFFYNILVSHLFLEMFNSEI